jgi:hypothetical protein
MSALASFFLCAGIYSFIITNRILLAKDGGGTVMKNLRCHQQRMETTDDKRFDGWKRDHIDKTRRMSLKN